MQYRSYTDRRGVLQQEYSKPPILLTPHFRWVVIKILYGSFWNAYLLVVVHNENTIKY